MQIAMSPASAVQMGASQKRVLRRPTHTFQLLRQRPFGITPFLIAPVLPGETLKNLTFQARCVTDPVKNPLVGWWLEHSFFYVKLRDLTAKSTVETMILDPDAGVSALNDAAASGRYYHAGTEVNWLKLCMEPIVREYFRDEGETWDTQLIDTLPKAQHSVRNWMDSFFALSEMPNDATAVGAEDFDDFYKRWTMWMQLRQQKMVNMTFEEYLGTYGVSVPNNTAGIPELLRTVRQWQYPSNTIDPADGSPTSAISWSVAERADKDRFFIEPGFIIGVSVARPKVYFYNQRSSAAHLLTHQANWMPAVLKDDPSTSIKEVAAATGPLGGVFSAAAYVVDVRDLYLHGDQHIDTFATDIGSANEVQLPLVGGHNTSLYVPDADIADMFVDDTNTSTSKHMVRQDGVVNLSILGTQIDHT